VLVVEVFVFLLFVRALLQGCCVLRRGALEHSVASWAICCQFVIIFNYLILWIILKKGTFAAAAIIANLDLNSPAEWRLQSSAFQLSHLSQSKYWLMQRRTVEGAKEWLTLTARHFIGSAGRLQ